MRPHFVGRTWLQLRMPRLRSSIAFRSASLKPLLRNTGKARHCPKLRSTPLHKCSSHPAPPDVRKVLFCLTARMGQSEDIMVKPMHLFHTAGSVLGALGAMTSLSTLVLPVVFDPELMLKAIEREGGTVTSGVPLCWPR